MFKKKFMVVENRPSGVIVTHYLEGKKADVMKDIEMFKKNSKHYVEFGKKGLVVFT